MSEYTHSVNQVGEEYDLELCHRREPDKNLLLTIHHFEIVDVRVLKPGTIVECKYGCGLHIRLSLAELWIVTQVQQYEIDEEPSIYDST